MIGRHVSHFYVIRSLGTGGTGVVYEAQDTRLPRSVAIKVLKSALSSDADAARRFKREARLASSLNHPNICTILEVDDVGGQSFIAMELLQGRSLKERLAEGPMAPADILSVGMQVATALAVAHERRIMHRDITPGNVFITKSGLVKVLDFGLAKYFLGEDDGSGTDSLTRAGSVPGTVPYMAPELFAGDVVPDHRCDLYSLGAVLYEMATGAKPFEARSKLELITLIQEQPHIPVCRLAPQHPRRLEVIIDGLLAKRPGDRYQNARDVQSELESLRQLASFCDTSTSKAASKPRAIAVMPFTVDGAAVEKLADVGDGVAEDICSRLSHVPELRVPPRTLTLQWLSLSPAELGHRLNVELILTGSVRRVGDGLRAQATLIDARNGLTAAPLIEVEAPLHDVFVAQDEVARQIVAHLTAGLARVGERPATSDTEALNAFKRGQHYWRDRFAGGWLTAIEQFERAVVRDPGFAPAHVALSTIYEFLASFCVMKPKLAYSVARRSIEQALNLNDKSAPAHVQLALIELGGEWDWEASEAAFRRALELDPSNAVAHVCYAWLLTLLGREAAAVEEACAGHELAPVSRFVTCGRAQTLYLARRYDEAIDLCTQCLGIDPDYPPARLIRGQCYELQGRLPEAIADLEHGVMTTDRMPYFLGVLGHCYGLTGMREQAIAVLQELDHVSRERYVPPQCYVFIHAGLGERAKALAFQERAYEDGASPFNYLAPYMRDLYARDPHHKGRLEQMRLVI